MHTHARTDTHTHTHWLTSPRAQTHTHSHTHTHTYTHTHTDIHTHSLSLTYTQTHTSTHSTKTHGHTHYVSQILRLNMTERNFSSWLVDCVFLFFRWYGIARPLWAVPTRSARTWRWAADTYRMLCTSSAFTTLGNRALLTLCIAYYILISLMRQLFLF